MTQLTRGASRPAAAAFGERRMAISVFPHSARRRRRHRTRSFGGRPAVVVRPAAIRPNVATASFRATERTGKGAAIS
jgi:hypothetical protein